MNPDSETIRSAAAEAVTAALFAAVPGVGRPASVLPPAELPGGGVLLSRRLSGLLPGLLPGRPGPGLIDVVGVAV